MGYTIQPLISIFLLSEVQVLSNRLSPGPEGQVQESGRRFHVSRGCHRMVPKGPLTETEGTEGTSWAVVSKLVCSVLSGQIAWEAWLLPHVPSFTLCLDPAAPASSTSEPAPLYPWTRNPSFQLMHMNSILAGQRLPLTPGRNAFTLFLCQMQY